MWNSQKCSVKYVNPEPALITNFNQNGWRLKAAFFMQKMRRVR